MAGRKPKPTTQDTPTPKGKLKLTQPMRLHPNDPRQTGHETTYQGSRGGWFRKG